MANGARVRVAVSWVVKGCLLDLLACLKFLKGSLERNEFHSRADGRLSAVEPMRLSRQERSVLLHGSDQKLRRCG